MDRSHVISALQKADGLSGAKASAVTDTFLNALTEALLRGERIEFRALGTFTVRQKPARPGKNPKTGAAITIPARRSVKFKANRTFLAALNPVDESAIKEKIDVNQACSR